MPITNQISNYASFKYVVTGTEPGPFHTIQSALDYANALGETTTILVRPGTYVENLTLYNGINIQGSEEGQVIINGLHTPPVAGSFTISKCTLVSATDVFSSAAAGAAVLTVANCTFNITAGYVFNLAAWTGDILIDDCLDQSTTNNIATNAAGASIEIMESVVGTAGGAGMVATGVTRIADSLVFCPLSLGGASEIDGCTIGAAIATSGVGDISINNSFIDSGAAAAINTTTTGQLTIADTTINSSVVNVITGTSDVELASVTYLNGSATVGVTIVTNSQLRCNHAHANEAMTIDAGNFNLTNGQLNINGSTGTNGQVIIASTGANPAWASLTAGSGVSITNGAGSISIAATGTDGIPWTTINADGTLAVNTARINIKAGALLTTTLPATAAVGTVIILQGSAAGNTGWLIAQNAGQNIQFGNTSTTIGVGGSLASTNNNDSVSMVCTVADTTWNVFSSVGNITIV